MRSVLSSLKKTAVFITAVVVLSGCVPSKKYLAEQGRGITGKETSYIRVLVLKSSKAVIISGDSGLRITNIQTHAVEHETDLKKAVFSPDKVRSPIVVEAGNKILNVNGTAYRGMIELRNSMGMICVINLVKMEDYLASVVPSEMSYSWPEESLKAQAVAARTYAYYFIMKKNTELYDLDATTNFQVYKGLVSENEKSTEAVHKTSGEVVTFQNQPILAFFHSTCGGKTADSFDVWGNESIPYLAAVPCAYCSASPYYRWEDDISISEISGYISEQYDGIGKIQSVSFVRKGGRVSEVQVRHSGGLLKISGNDFRTALPEKRLKSLAFDSKKNGKVLHITGRGWGHGVGMCQYGARGMAEKGRSYKDILNHYYLNVSYVTMNNGR
jgi:stage II sporulation protein D